MCLNHPKTKTFPILKTSAAPFLVCGKTVFNETNHLVQFSCSVVPDSLQSHGPQHTRPPLSITNSWSLLRLMSIESVLPSSHLILCRPLVLLPSIFPSIRWPKYWSFSLSISPSNEHPGLVSFRMNWLDLLAIQVTLFRFY